MLRCTSRTPFFLCVVLLLLPTLATAEIKPETLLVQMRDGVSLSTDVYRSADRPRWIVTKCTFGPKDWYQKMYVIQ